MRRDASRSIAANSIEGIWASVLPVSIALAWYSSFSASRLLLSNSMYSKSSIAMLFILSMCSKENGEVGNHANYDKQHCTPQWREYPPP